MGNTLMPMVSVRFMVYNNEAYIREAIESILMQKTDFLVEIVVGDDFSTDNTLNIIKEYSNTDNIYINILKREVGDAYWEKRQKLGRLYNFKDILDHCSGKYIALLDGDDYWTDPLKLQKQVDFLEKNTDHNICFHRANLFKDDKIELHSIPNNFNSQSFYYIELLKHYNFITTASALLRKPKHFKIPNWFVDISFGDLGLYKILSLDKKIKCIDEIMSVYRIHDEGIYSKLKRNQIEANYLNFYRTIKPHIKTEEKKVVKEKINIALKVLTKLKYPNSRFMQLLYNANLKIRHS